MTERPGKSRAGKQAPAGTPSETAETLPDTSPGRGPAPASPLPGVGPLGKYTDVQRLGSGGMAFVYQGFDPEMRRPVAIKVLRSEGAADLEMRRRFIAEARITGQLEHPNIVPAYELGRLPEGDPYLAMRLVKGRSLADVLAERCQERARRSSPGRVDRRLLADFRKVIDAVAFAHSRGVVHRDMKPANIMIGEFGEVLVMDWGLAKTRSAERGTRSSGTVEGIEEDAALTRAGAVMGTPAYMPPEQAEGRVDRIGPASDVYALGAILYEILTLERPFRGESAGEILRAVIDGKLEAPAARGSGTQIPPELDAIVVKAMAYEPGNRYGSAQELGADIDAFVAGHSVSARRDPVLVRGLKWARRHKALAAGVAAGIAALAAGVLGMFAWQEARTARKVEDLLERAAEDFDAGRVSQAEQACTQALALDGANARAHELRVRVGFAAEAHRKRRDLEARVLDLRAELDRHFDEAGAVPVAGAARETRSSWIEARTKCLGTAREIFRISQDSADGVPVIEIARELARDFSNDGKFEMAEILIQEAVAAGLAETLAEVDRLQIENARAQHDREAGESVRRVEEALDRLSGAPGSREIREDALAQILRSSSPAVVSVLVREALPSPDPAARAARSGRRGVAIEALGRIGDSRTTALVSGSDIPPRAAAQPDSDRELLAELARLDEEIRSLWISKEGLTKLDASMALVIALAALDPRANPAESLAVAQALARLGRPETAEALDLARWTAGPGTRFWEETARAISQIPSPAGEPDDPAAFARRGRMRLGRGEFESGASDLARAIERNADSARLHWMLGLALAPLGDRTEASRAFDRAISLAPARAEFLVSRATLRADSGEIGEALEDLRRAIDVDPGFLPARVHLGNVLARAGDTDGALEAFQAASAMAPDWSLPALGRARVLISRGEGQRAILVADDVLRTDPELAPAQVIRAQALLAAGEDIRALADLDRAIQLAPEFVEAYVERARVRSERRARRYLEQRGLEQRGLEQRGAVDDLERAHVLAPRSPELLVALGMAKFRLVRLTFQGELNLSAIDHFDRALAIDPTRTDALLGRALARVAAGDHDQALEDFGVLLERDPTNVLARVGRASVLAGKGKREEAARDLNDAAQAAPDAAEVHLGIGELAWFAGEIERAIASTGRALECEPIEWTTRIEAERRASMYRYLRGEAFVQSGDLDRGIEDLGHAVRIMPISWRYLLAYGEALAAAERLPEALEVLGRARDHAEDAIRQAIARRIEQLEGR